MLTVEACSLYEPGDAEEEILEGAGLSCGGILGATAGGQSTAMDNQRRFVVLVCDYKTAALRSEQLGRFLDHFYPMEAPARETEGSMSSIEPVPSKSFDREPRKLPPDTHVHSSLTSLMASDQQIPGSPGVYWQMTPETVVEKR